MSTLHPLLHRTALVGGSTQGIGRAIAQQFAKAGAQVVLLARNADRLEALCKELPLINEEKPHRWVAADFSRPDMVEEEVRKYLTQHGPVHILVNNTGGPPSGPLTDATEQSFLTAFQSHLLCNHLLAKAVVPGMQAVGYGRIINIVSTSVKIPLPNLGVSNTIRGAVASWAKTLANELAPFGITVNNILPGATETARLKAIIAAKAAKTGLSEEEVTRDMQAEIPMRRFGRAEEIASLAEFLAGSGAAYITGTSIPVDGGRTGSL
jgi:3-oxoacyl-[acyl-carrier protein] reductase